MKKKPFRTRQLDQNAIPTTSLADMMFLLLIFFIMTTTLTRITGFNTDIPAGSKEQKQETADKTPTVALHDEKVNLNGEDVSMDRLREYVRSLNLAQKTGDAKVVIVSSAGAVTYQNYYETLSIIQNGGGVVAIVTEGAGAEK
jgi:biopolymer transport protein ExbD